MATKKKGGEDRAFGAVFVTGEAAATIESMERERDEAQKNAALDRKAMLDRMRKSEVDAAVWRARLKLQVDAAAIYVAECGRLLRVIHAMEQAAALVGGEAWAAVTKASGKQPGQPTGDVEVFIAE